MSTSVVLVRPIGDRPPYEHEALTQRAVARMLADLTGWEFRDVWQDESGYVGRTFFVPLGTLLSGEASSLGITGADDLYGGVVPYAFMKTRAISHGLVGRHATRPPGWSDTFSAAVASSVLPGFTAFTSDDARLGSRRLLERGPVRLKPPAAAGARQQRVVRSLAEVDAALASVSGAEIAEYGLVLEPELRHVLTLSVGRVSVDRRLVSYIGTQRQTLDNDGRAVYGGSDLLVVPGDWDALDRLDVGPGTRQAVRDAVTYDAAADRIEGFFASRRNYDVVIGSDRRRRRVGFSRRPGASAAPAPERSRPCRSSTAITGSGPCGWRRWTATASTWRCRRTR